MKNGWKQSENWKKKDRGRQKVFQDLSYGQCKDIKTIVVLLNRRWDDLRNSYAHYVEDDTFQISEEIKNMSDEERRQQIKIWEEEGRREKKKIKERKLLRTI